MSFPLSNTPVTITLYKNIPFDNTYSDVPFFARNVFKYDNNTSNSKIGDYETFLNIRKLMVGRPKHFPSTTLVGQYNFNFANSLKTSIVLDFENIGNTWLDSNYMRVDSNGEYYYYFITNYTQNNFNVYKLELELDIFGTYSKEFMKGIKNKPVFAKRKHSHRFGKDFIFKCPDTMINEDITSGYKPKNITSTKSLRLDYTGDPTNILSNINWAYVSFLRTSDDKTSYTIGNGTTKVEVPFGIVCIPLVDKLSVYIDNQLFYAGHPLKLLTEMFDSTRVASIKISPYPPFTTLNGGSVTYDSIDDVLSFKFPSSIHSDDLFNLGNNKISPFLYNPTITGFAFLICEQGDTEYSYQKVSLLKQPNGIEWYSLRDNSNEPKLQCTPITNVKLKTIYNEGYDLYPEYICSYYKGNNVSNSIPTFKTIATSYTGDFSFLHYVDCNKTYFNDFTYTNSKYCAIGLTSSPDYTYPYGTDAVKQFNATQKSQYSVSKIASGVAGTLAIAGGVALMVASQGSSSGLSVGVIKGGITAVSGAVAVGGSISSSVAKDIDLKNTPDTLNAIGSNFAHDIGSDIGNGLLPYLVTYKPSLEEEKMFSDYFYNYGYQVSRECVFNDELKYEVSIDNSDNNLITRGLFNYVQLDEDISNKITSDLPFVVKKKFSEVFKNGVKLWTLFDIVRIQEQLIIIDLYKYLLNDKYENSETTFVFETDETE